MAVQIRAGAHALRIFVHFPPHVLPCPARFYLFLSLPELLTYHLAAWQYRASF